MSLILAVEPDRQQASRLSAVLSGRLEAELAIAESASRALETLGDRVPDVLLTSPLLSRQEEAVLAAHLRDLGGAAAHVQVLTIPILAASCSAESRRGGMLSMLRRRRTSTSTPDGCEPAVFADQVALYLQRAETDRVVAAQAEPEPIAVLNPEPDPVPIAVVAPEPELIAIAEPELETSPMFEPEPEPEPVVALAPQPDPLPVFEPDPEPLPVFEPEPEPEPAIVFMLEAAPEAEPIVLPEAGPAPEPLAASEPVAAPEPIAEEPPPNVVVPWFASMLSLLLGRRSAEVPETMSVVEPQILVADADPDPIQFTPEDDAVWIDVPLEELREPPSFRRASEPDTPPEPEDVWVLPPITDIPDVIVRVEPEPAVEVVPSAPTPKAAEPDPPAPKPAPKKKAARPKKKPVQDEWGLFDPDQCGFAALLDKLDEVTDEGVESRDTTVRVVSY